MIFFGRAPRAIWCGSLLAIAAVASGCTDSASRQSSVSYRPPKIIPGTLYVANRENITQLPTWRILRNGKEVGTFRASNFAVARERPSVKLFVGLDPESVHGVIGATDSNTMDLPDGCNNSEVELSPDGTYGLCNADSKLFLFNVRSRKVVRTVTSNLALVDLEGYAFLPGNLIAAMFEDEACASPAVGTVEEPWARVYFMRFDGTRTHKGPCAFGVVSGRARVAYSSYRDRKPVYSFDGKDWRPGYPTAFDGADDLILLDNDGPKLDSGELPFAGVGSADDFRWSE
jgi:hypothetical protein